MKQYPKFYNDLEETKKEILSLLFQGVKKRKSNFHNTILNTVGLNQKPESRTVVLRGFSANELSIKIHSDVRSKKISEIKKNENVSLVFYDPQKKIQLRIRGFAKIKEAELDSWKNLNTWSRRCYLTTLAPGMVTENPSSGFPENFESNAPTFDESEKGFKNFSVIKILIDQIEWLFLASQGHRRALYSVIRKKSKIDIKSKWLVP
tara:strand:- start:114 stop:731 length:618 start_codon:yes stop_codon:yes gene_type:complete